MRNPASALSLSHALSGLLVAVLKLFHKPQRFCAFIFYFSTAVMINCTKRNFRSLKHLIGIVCGPPLAERLNSRPHDSNEMCTAILNAEHHFKSRVVVQGEPGVVATSRNS